jgi:hypothetical protein
MRQGFGTRVIERMIRGSLKGKMRFDWRAEGLACEIACPCEVERSRRRSERGVRPISALGKADTASFRGRAGAQGGSRVISTREIARRKA